MTTAQFVLIARHDPQETVRLFASAAAARRLDFVQIVPGEAAGAALARPGTRRLLFCAAVDRAAQLVEKLLHTPGTAALHDPHFICDHHPIAFRQAGLPVAKAVYAPSADRDTLARQADWLGGYPLVVKRPGTQGGAGVSLARSRDDLAAQLEAARGVAMIEAFVPHRRSWRVTVLGGQLLAAHARIAGADDFRTNGPGSHADFSARVPPEAAEIAIAAAKGLRLDFGGADILEGEDGALTLAEFNFPCYFADQQAALGIDIAGQIIDWLAVKP